MMDPLTDEDLEFLGDTLEEGPEPEELQAAKEVITSFLRAIKNYGFYPEKHPTCQESITTAASRLDNFLQNHDKLRFDVEMDRLLFRGEVVQHGETDDGNLGLLLFRDGIQWLEFRKGLTIEEISGFIRIVNRYREASEDAEGDLVTALWEADFGNLKYKAIDVYWEAEPLIDLSVLSVREKDDRDIDLDKEEPQEQIILPPKESTLWKLTPEEMRGLREMIHEEERRDTLQDVLDILLIVLNDQQCEEDLAALLDFLRDEFQYTLAQREFLFALELLTALHESRRAYKSKRPWAPPLLDKFFLGISSPQVLGALSQAWPNLDMLDAEQMKLLRQVLLLLPAESVLALGPMLLQLRSSSARREFMEIIAMQAKRDLRPLKRLLRRPEVFMVQRLVNILGHLKGKEPTQLLIKMVGHPSERVRDHALRFLVARNLGPKLLEKLFPLVDDTSASIRQMMFSYLGRRRSEVAEGLLLDYMQQGQFRQKDREQILACYRALGRCGSPRSVPLLREVLMSRAWMPGFGRSVHRQGAVMSLIELGNGEAKEILRRASQSLSPRIRRAYRKAAEAER
ncbi:MAG: HEAT repeat domain-containing protein [Thermodesulfobacteriota bacterium]|nr:HEAT repeat domain-containing protein [Thermodesulfobacteriota bacterium]